MSSESGPEIGPESGKVTPQTFQAVVAKDGSRFLIFLPFDPNKVWGAKERHSVSGSINGCMVRGALGSDGAPYFLALGAAWRRDNGIDADMQVTVTLAPEGPQSAALAPDIAAALAQEAQAQQFFDNLPTFYRKNYIRWIESAKRPETRAARIREMVELLKAGKREK